MASSWKTSCYPQKSILESNCKHLLADGIVCMQNKAQMFDLDMEVIGKKCKRQQKVFQKRWAAHLTFRNPRLPLQFMLSNVSGKPIQHVVSFWLWGNAIYLMCFGQTKKELLSMLKACCYHFIIKTYQKWFSCYQLPCSLKIFIKLMCLLFCKKRQILRKIVEKYIFLFLQKNINFVF